jgi:hypothetical protein
MTPWGWAALAVVAAGLAVGAWVRFGPRPTGEGPWVLEHRVAPEFVVGGSTLTVRGLRNFAWASATAFEPQWEERSFDLDRVERVWYVLAPLARAWRGPAHALVSFEFEDGGFLAISVEARRREGRRYGFVKGILRRFELIYVAGDERDLVGLRALHRGGDVYAYPAAASPEGARALLLDMAQAANRLREHPEHYHTIWNNCTTRIVDHVNRVTSRPVGRSWRILLSGYSDVLAHELGFLDGAGPDGTPGAGGIRELRARWYVNERAREWADADDFSIRIREPS